MNWDAISSISELVSAAAVVITLVYLTMEIRRTRKATESQGTLASVSLASNVRTNILQNSDIAEALAKVNTGESLSNQQQVQIAMLSDELFISLAVAHEFTHQTGGLHDQSAEIQYGKDILKANPGLAPEWQRLRPFVKLISAGMVAALDSVLHEGASDAKSAT